MGSNDEANRPTPGNEFDDANVSAAAGATENVSLGSPSATGATTPMPPQQQPLQQQPPQQPRPGLGGQPEGYTGRAVPPQQFTGPQSYQPRSAYPPNQAPYGAQAGAAQSTGTQPFGVYGMSPQQGGGAAPQYAQAPAAPAQGSGRRRTAGLVLACLLAGAVGGGAVIGLSSVGGNSVTATGTSLQTVTRAEPASTSSNTGVKGVADKVLPSVVSIRVAGVVQGQQVQGEGSGVIISDDGLIVTNNHVASAGGAEGELQVIFNDGNRATAKVVGTDPITDIAVIKAENVSGLTRIEMGSAEDVSVGEQVVAIGSPLGLSGTVTEGIVSAKNRPVSAGGSETGQATVLDAIQTDAAINQGNSGGALVDMSGTLIGMNSAIASLGQGSASGSIGLGFAIPVDQVRSIAQQLIDTGKAKHAAIGVALRNDATGNGAVVGQVTADSAAAKAGIKEGAVITRLGDRLITSAEDLVAAVRSHQPGEQVTLTVTAAGEQEKTVELTLGEASS